MPPEFKSFTTTFPRFANVLRNECRISEAFDPTLPPSLRPVTEEFMAIWDTGATNSVVTEAVVDKCGLIPTGMVKTSGVHGTRLSETYLVNVILPNKVGIPNVRVTRGNFPGGRYPN